MASANDEEDADKGLQDHWYLVDTHGQKFRLPKTMLFLGREECDIVVASQTVDRRHAVLTFDHYLNHFKVKDLSTTNGTFVNNARIPKEEYITLSHMDSIRLGQDAMMYHIEQGRHISGGQIPDPHYIPSWASRAQDSGATIHVHASHALAECQGCMAEQKPEHTCNLKSEPRTNGIPMSDTKHLTYNTQQYNQQQELAKEYQPHTKPSPKLPPYRNDDQHCHHLDQPSSHEQTVPVDGHMSVIDDTSSHFYDNSDTASGSRNTRPRKRQNKQVANTGPVLDPEASESPDKTTSEAHPAGSVQTMFFVTFDDSVCNANNSTLSTDHERRPRTTRNPLPSELATVKKGTPLYGQPSWWGEADGDAAVSNSCRTHGESKSKNNSRPTNLGLSESEASSTKIPGTVPKTGNMETEPIKPYLTPTYMEIPIKGDNSPDAAEKSKDVPTPAKSISSSLSKDSLSISPELKQSNRSAKMASTSPEVNPSMSFTVDLEDSEHLPKKSLNIGSSISEFVPSKIRKNFRERKSVSSKSSKESTPSKNSEERELSPISQGKIDEIWSKVVEGKGKSRLSSGQATAGSYLRSPNLEEIGRLSEFSEERRSVEKDSDRKAGPFKRPISNKSPQLPQKVIPSASMGSRSPAGVASVTQYTDPTSYLIDRMFEGGGPDPSQSDIQQSPEVKMYREAASYNKTVSSLRPTEKTIVRPVIDSTYSPTATKNARKTALPKAVQQPTIHDVQNVIDDDDDLRIIEDSPGGDNGVEEKDDKEDKASEAGTYTIEADIKEGSEEEEARKRIDQVFGVDVENFNADKPIIDPLRLASPGGYDNVYDLIDDGEQTPLDETSRSPVDTDLTLDDDDEDYDGENSDMAVTEGVQMWVSQLTALTNQKSGEAIILPKEDGEYGETSLSKKPPQGISRKRPGTGRRLPSIPSDKSPVSSEHDSQATDLDLMIGDDVSTGRTPEPMANGRKSADGRYRSGLNTSQPPSKTVNNGHHPESPNISSRSRGSVDTEVLLQDTATVMAAIQARISHKSSNGRKDSYSQDSDTDASSTVALVNGDESYVKPSLYKSPRDALAQRQRADVSTKPGSTPSTTPVPSSKKQVTHSYSQSALSKSTASPRSTPPSSGVRKSVVSDMVSRRDSVDNDSIISDISSEAGESSISRTSSKGKGTITMTRTNKTFNLRRARVDSFEEPTTGISSRSSASSRSNATNSSVGRSQSLHSTTRNRSLATTSRSETTSLGAQIVKKSQCNISQEKARKPGNLPASRTEAVTNRPNQGQRLQHSTSVTASQPLSGKREPTPKSHLRLTPTNKAGLTISGISNVSSRSQSQPGSRSNSPKAAEKMAWKRRKEYDARKSVAEAKASKTKEVGSSGVTLRPKLSASSSMRRRMIRSASFTNSVGLSLGVHSSVSGSQDFSDRKDSYDQHEEFRRAFIPFHNALRADRSTHSADEDDSLVSAHSTQDMARSMVTLLDTPSAFTPPPHRNKSISPEITPPSKAYLSLRRRTLNFEVSSLATEQQTNGYADDIRRSRNESPHQTSYDSLIVASIYQLSLKLKTCTDKTLSKLRDQNRVSLTPSPIDDYLTDSTKSEITAWKTANQELAGTLKNLRKLERHVQMMNTVIFPDTDVNSEVSSDVPASRQVKQKLLEDIERKFGFQPIYQPHPHQGGFASPEMEEFSGQF